MSYIAAGTGSGNAFVQTSDTTGNLVFQTNGTTTALTLTTTQAANFANAVSATGNILTAGVISSAGTVNAPNTFGFKNRIINGGMVISQRYGTTSTSLPDGASNYYFIVDRFACSRAVGATATGQQVTTAPTGFINSLKITNGTGITVGSTGQGYVNHYIEGLNIADLNWGTVNAKTVTLSFWVQSSITGTHSGSLFNSASNRCYVYTYTISVANTWEYKTVTIPGDTTGTWLTTNGRGIAVCFNNGSGSSYLGTAGSWGSSLYFGATGSVALNSVTGSTWYVTGVQFEIGSQATSFDFRDYGGELLLCQRYCQVLGTGSMGRWNSTSGFENGVLFKTTMRTTPSVSAYTTSPSVYNIGVASTTASGYNPSINTGSPTGAMLVGTINAWGSAASGAFMAMASDAMLFTAEL